MSLPFFKLSKRLLNASPGAWVLTPNERLARELKRAYDLEWPKLGKADWVPPQVASIHQFFISRAAEVVTNGGRLRLLSADAEWLLWREVGERNSESLCGLAAEAWRLAHAYRMDLDDAAFATTINSRTFRRWGRRFRARLKSDGLLSAAELPDHIGGRAEILYLVAFDVVTPQLAEFLRRTERAGGKVRFHQPGAIRKGPRKRVEIASQASEIHAAAQWARRVLGRYPSARIGVVFPYLTDAYQAIAHAFRVAFAEHPEAVDLAGGTPLGEQPIWRDAELLLRLAVGEIGHRDWLQLRRSHWLNLGTPLHLPEPCPELLSARHFTKTNPRMRKLAGYGKQWPTRQSFAQWMGDFHAILALAGWLGAKAASTQFQARAKLAECLERFATYPQLPSLTGSDALQILQRLLARHLFAPERPAAPVRVLGYLETTGLSFTHLWVAGLQDTAWPAPPQPNPLLSIPLQRLHGVPRLDHALEADFAAAQTERWQRAARYLVVSHALRDGEEQHRASGLIESIAAVPIERLAPGFGIRQRLGMHRPSGGHRQAARSHPARPTKPATNALQAVAAINTATAAWGSPVRERVSKGGTALFRDQAQCPFRAWAIHRLGFDEVREPRAFPDALERGILIHDALFALYQTGRATITDGLIEAVVAKAVDKHLRHSPALYRRNEQLRLRGLLRTWTDYDTEQPDFSVVGLEQQTELNLPGFTLSLRIDRMERDRRTGALVVIDYKTGNVTANRLLADRLTEPQLPMYALSDARIRATLYAQFGSENVAIKGLASEELELGGSGVRQLSAADWRMLTSRWRTQIESLAREFRNGFAAVAPASQAVCGRCHLASFCRVRALTPELH